MKNFIQKYTGFLRNFRLIHYLYNLLHRQGLKHNKFLYRKFDIKKSVYKSISHKDFIGKKPKAPWLDGIISENEIQNHPVFCHFAAPLEQQLLKWHKQGFLIWNNFLNDELVEAINNEIDVLLDKNKVDFNYTGRKIFNAYKVSYTIRKVMKDKNLLKLLSFILDRKVIPFQSINFLKGSEQQAHSDSIHMTTFPKGYMIAAWFALEDITLEQGPISYYPGSHILPYITNADYENTSNQFMLDGNANKKFEAKTLTVIKENHLQKEIFLAKKGDVFIWHANLIHGGEEQLNKSLTRKSMVVHFFAEDVIAYHEISERPAIFDTELVGEIQDDFYKGQTDVLDY
jgi:ectoine hydroxylase